MSLERSNLDTQTFIDGQCGELWYLVFDVNSYVRKGRNQTTQNGIRCFLRSEIDKNFCITSLWQGKVMVIFRFWWNIVEIIFYRLQDFVDLVHNTTSSVSSKIFKIRLFLHVISSFLEELVLKNANRTSQLVFLTTNQLFLVILLSVHHCPKPLARVSLG